MTTKFTKKDKRNIMIALVVGFVVIVGGVFGCLVWLQGQPGKYDEFAQC